MPQNPNKTKGEILSELESIKGLLVEEDDIPILQEVELQDFDPIALPFRKPGGTQASMFDDLLEEITPLPLDQALHPSPAPTRPVPKAAGENPFLPQHIRDRLQGNNPPPFFDFDMSQKINHAYKTIGKASYENRHDLVNDLIKRYLPQIEQDLRLKLLAMTEEELKKLTPS